MTPADSTSSKGVTDGRARRAAPREGPAPARADHPSGGTDHGRPAARASRAVVAARRRVATRPSGDAPRLPAPSGDRRGALVAVAVTIVFSASVFAGIRAGLRGYGPFQLVALRFILASLLLLALARPLRVGLPQRRDLPVIFALSFCGIGVYQVALAIGEQHVAAGVTSMIVASQTIIAAGLATVFRHRLGSGGEKPRSSVSSMGGPMTTWPGGHFATRPGTPPSRRSRPPRW